MSKHEGGSFVAAMRLLTKVGVQQPNTLQKLGILTLLSGHMLSALGNHGG